MRFFYLIVTLLLISVPACAQENAATLFLYTNDVQELSDEISFADQIDLLQDSATILPLKAILKQWKDGGAPPSKSAAIILKSNDPGFLSGAISTLEKHRLPFTLFITPPLRDKGTPAQIGWNDVKKIHKMKQATLGMTLRYDTPYQDIEAFQRDLNATRSLMREKLGFIPRLLFIPKYNADQLKIIHEQGFIPFAPNDKQAQNPFDTYYHSPIPLFYMRPSMRNDFALNLILNGQWKEKSD